MTAERIWEEILTERARQEELWAGPHGWGAGSCASTTLPDIVKATVLAEECGEVSRAVLERDAPGLRVELVQVAAIAVAWLEALAGAVR